MEILIDGALKAQTTSATIAWSCDTLTMLNGSHTILVRAYDSNNIGSSSISVGVQNSVDADTVAPTVTISSPTNGATVRNTVKIYVNSADQVGVTKVEFYLNGALFGSSISATPVFNWNTRYAAKGAHTLQAYAYDVAGNIGASNLTTVYK